MDKVGHYIYFDSIKIEVPKPTFQAIIDAIQYNQLLVRQFDDGLVTEYWMCEPSATLDGGIRLPFPPKNCVLLGYTCSNTF